jgi:hypothetical protein
MERRTVLKLCPMCGEAAFVLTRRDGADGMPDSMSGDKYECLKCGYTKRVFVPQRKPSHLRPR